MAERRKDADFVRGVLFVYFAAFGGGVVFLDVGAEREEISVNEAEFVRPIVVI